MNRLTLVFFLFAICTIARADQEARWASLVGGDDFLCLLDAGGVQCADDKGVVSADRLPPLAEPFRLQTVGGEICAGTQTGTACWPFGKSQATDRGDLLWRAPLAEAHSDKTTCSAKAAGVECNGFLYNRFGKELVFPAEKVTLISLHDRMLCYRGEKGWGCGDLSSSSRVANRFVPFHRVEIKPPAGVATALVQTRSGHACALVGRKVLCLELTWEDGKTMHCLSRGGQDRQCRAHAIEIDSLSGAEAIAPYGDAICGLQDQTLVCFDLKRGDSVRAPLAFRALHFHDFDLKEAPATLEKLSADIYLKKAKVLSAAAAQLRKSPTETSQLFVLNLIRPLLEDVATPAFETEVLPQFHRTLARLNYPRHRDGLISFRSDAASDPAALALAASALQAIAADHEADDYTGVLGELGRALSEPVTPAVRAGVSQALEKVRAALSEVANADDTAMRGPAKLVLLIADYLRAN